MECDIYCHVSNLDKLKVDMTLAYNSMKYTYDPWHFFGEDFYFSKAEYNFEYLDGVFQKYENMGYSLFSEYLESTKKYSNV